MRAEIPKPEFVMKLGTLALNSNLFLAPMSGITDFPFDDWQKRRDAVWFSLRWSVQKDCHAKGSLY